MNAQPGRNKDTTLLPTYHPLLTRKRAAVSEDLETRQETLTVCVFMPPTPKNLIINEIKGRTGETTPRQKKRMTGKGLSPKTGG